jgi:hypothetical protein
MRREWRQQRHQCAPGVGAFLRRQAYARPAQPVGEPEPEPEADIEEAAILRRIVAFLLAYYEARGLVIDEILAQQEVEDINTVAS